MKKISIVSTGLFLTVSTFMLALLFLILGGEVLAESTRGVKKSGKTPGVVKEMLYEVVYPLGKTMMKEIPLAPRLTDLRGKTICALSNHVFQYKVTFPALGELLQKQYPELKFIPYTEFPDSHDESAAGKKAMEGLANLLLQKGCQAVISGNGGWGTCTPASARASIIAEKAGIPSVTVVSSGFEESARGTGQGAGIIGLRVAVYPGAFDLDTPEKLRKNTEEVLLPQVVKALTESASMGKVETIEPGVREIIFKGTFEQVNNYFYKKQWSDGLPIIPPTVEKVKEFLQYTDRSPEDIVGVLLPARREASIWSIAVNGVMAGCRPEHMPVLIAVVEAIADPNFGLEHAGSTSGWEPIIIINGPIIQELGFNTGVGVLRVGNQANTSVGRFLRLFMRNVAGYLPGITDQASFGRTFFVALAEAESASPWEPLNVSRGFKKGTSTVTVNSVIHMGYHFSAMGKTSEDMLQFVSDQIKHVLTSGTGALILTFGPKMAPQLVLTPVVAKKIAERGYSRKDVQQYLYDHTKIPASELDRLLIMGMTPKTTCEFVKEGKLPAQFCESSDPKRLVPLVHSPDEFLIVVAGDLMRNRSFATQQCGWQGLATTKEIKLPANWDKLMAEIRK